MSLSTLPTEIIALVARELGPAFYKEDLSRLTLCKTWYPFALGTLHSQILLTESSKLWTILRSFRKPIPNEPPYSLRSLVREVTVSIRANEVLRSVPEDLNPLVYVLRAINTCARLCKVFKPIQYLSHFRQLRCLNLEVDFRRYLPKTTLLPVHISRDSFCQLMEQLSQQTLPSIRELRIAFYGPKLSDSAFEPPLHACDTMKRVLGRFKQLEELYVCIDEICPRILELPTASRGFALRSLHVDLGYHDQDGRSFNAEWCGSEHQDLPSRQDALQRANHLARAMSDAARSFAQTRAPSAEDFRVSWSNPYHDVAMAGPFRDHERARSLPVSLSLDCITDQVYSFLPGCSDKDGGAPIDLKAETARIEKTIDYLVRECLISSIRGQG